MEFSEIFIVCIFLFFICYILGISVQSRKGDEAPDSGSLRERRETEIVLNKDTLPSVVLSFVRNCLEQSGIHYFIHKNGNLVEFNIDLGDGDSARAFVHILEKADNALVLDVLVYKLTSPQRELQLLDFTCRVNYHLLKGHLLFDQNSGYVAYRIQLPRYDTHLDIPAMQHLINYMAGFSWKYGIYYYRVVELEESPESVIEDILR